MFREIVTTAIGLAIYVQTAGAFVWLVVVVLLERARREDRRRLLAVESSLDELWARTSKAINEITDTFKATDEICECRQRAVELRGQLREQKSIRQLVLQAWFCSKCNKLFCFGPDHPDGFEPPRDFCDDCGHRLELRDYP